MIDSSLTVREIMTTALITMKARDTVRHADVDMKLANIRHIPVVDDKNHLIGILSNRDVLRALGGTEEDEERDGVIIGDIMTRQVHTVREDTPAFEAAEIMLEQKIGALPVIGDEEQLVGLVTETDFVRIAAEALAGE